MSERTVRLEQLLPLMEEQLAAGKKVRFSPRGTSMLPMLRQGQDSVVLSPVSEKLKKYDLPLYRRENGQCVPHRVVKAEETYSCIGDNQYPLETGGRHEQMIALVTAFVRNGRERSVEDWRYQAYCRIWHYSRPVRYICGRCKGILKSLLKRLFG